MKILKDLFFINKKDVFHEYGAFLTESEAGGHSNYDALLTPPRMKPYTAVSYREEDGENLPDELPIPRHEARDVTLYFAIMANDTTTWMDKYNGFMRLLKSGWLDIAVPELKKTYRMYYKESSQYEQLTPINHSPMVCRFKVILREPKPNPEF